MALPARTTGSNHNGFTVTQWINSSYISTNSTSTLTNQINVINTVGNTVMLPVSQTSANNIFYLEQNYIELLKGRGIDLPDGGILKIVDDEVVIEYRHCDNVHPMYRLRGTLDLKAGLHELIPGMILRAPDGSMFKIEDDGTVCKESFINAREKVIDVDSDNLALLEYIGFGQFNEIPLQAGLNSKTTFTLPNGVKIKLFPDDHIEIDESDGRQLYKTVPTREFNKYLNGSDLLEEFIAYCAKQNLTQKEFSELPISLFIYWLIVEAAHVDGDSTEDTLPLLTSAVRERKMHTHRCKCCGKFLSKKMETHSISFCSTEHMGQYMERI